MQTDQSTSNAPALPDTGNAPSSESIEARIDAVLAGSRGIHHQDGSLWMELLSNIHSEDALAAEQKLCKALEEQYGVAVIAEQVWDTVKRIEDSPDQAAQQQIWIEFQGRPALFSEAPWSQSSITAVARRAGASLVLARPGQMQRLRGAGRAGAVSPPATIGPLAMTGTHPGSMSNSQASLSAGSLSALSVVQFVDEAIIRAYQEGVSDIHFETSRAGISIKYRIDGVMVAGEKLKEPARAEEVISRIKVMSQLDITERRRPQDGRIHWSRTGHAEMDLRVSIMPSLFGEDAVLRLLDKAQMRQTQATFSLDALGFDSSVAEVIRQLAGRPHGMLLITGPTGSGKTTTIYAALSEVNDGLEKIVTIEDPVEYELPGVLQIPVNEQKGLTFATGLRSILRHDPDKILVGEIRDSETAEIAIQSSLTGHLVFTTVHANSLFDVLGRFQHFGIDPFALASALNGVVVQRLLRRLCTHCAGLRDSTEQEKKLLATLDISLAQRIPHARGCEQCRHTGYRGRFVVAEVHGLNVEIRDMIVRKTLMSELRQVMYQDPQSRLLARAMDKVTSGVTTLEEVSRVVGLF